MRSICTHLIGHFVGDKCASNVFHRGNSDRKPNQLIHARIFTIISIYDISIMKIHHDQLVVFSIVIHDKVFYYPFYTQCPAHNIM